MITDKNERRELFEQFLRCIDREENLIHYRMSWGLQWNAAIFASVIGVTVIHFPYPIIIPLIQIVLGIMGALSGWFSYVGVNAAFEQSNYLIENLEVELGISTDKDWEKSGFLRPYGEKGTIHFPARQAAIKFPLLFIGVWTVFVASVLVSLGSNLHA